MRQRLDRLIERLRRHVEGNPSDPLGEYLADLLSTGRLTPGIARRIRNLHRKAVAGLEPRPQPDGDECDE